MVIRASGLVREAVFLALPPFGLLPLCVRRSKRLASSPKVFIYAFMNALFRLFKFI